MFSQTVFHCHTRKDSLLFFSCHWHYTTGCHTCTRSSQTELGSYSDLKAFVFVDSSDDLPTVHSKTNITHTFAKSDIDC